jgi:hypothetical protein
MATKDLGCPNSRSLALLGMTGGKQVPRVARDDRGESRSLALLGMTMEKQFPGFSG